ncbi:MAG: helix-turn-helix domain-containing protein [Polyangiaceae bacterium]|nr:helix-turn-helix domain-containing protein [Polyangiaceae bacterium]
MTTPAKKTHPSPQSRPRIVTRRGRRGPSRYADRRVELPLAELRDFAGSKTQVDVTRASGIPQPEVSKIERRPDIDVLSVATLRKYIEAIGAELELVAIVNGKRIVIQRKQ